MTPTHHPARFRARREALGLTLEQVHAETRIPVEHLRAIEAGRLSDLPEGPWRKVWVRAYEELLAARAPAEGADPVAVEVSPAASDEIEPIRLGGRDARRDDVDQARPTAPLWLVQGVAVVAGVALVAGIAWQVMHGLDPRPAGDPEAAPAGPPDQHVTVQATRNDTRITILVDGELAVDRTLANGEEVEVAGHRRVEIDLPAVEAARVTWNGEPIVPQGRQDEARRLVFVDDVEGGP